MLFPFVMNKTRCVNCGLQLNEKAGIECKLLKHISGVVHFKTKITTNLVSKLEKWIYPEIVQPFNRICERCLGVLRSSRKQRCMWMVCLGCGCCIEKDKSHNVTGLDLEVCRSWVPSGVSVSHLTKICDSCFTRLKLHQVKTETEFIEVELGTEQTIITSMEIKTESECIETINERLISIENEPQSSEKDPIPLEVYVKEENIDSDETGDSYKSNSDEEASVNNDVSEYYSEIENLLTNDTKDGLNENSNNEIETVRSDIENPSDEDNICNVSLSERKDKTKRKWCRKPMNYDSDDDYVPSISLKDIPKRTTRNNGECTIDKHNIPTTRTINNDKETYEFVTLEKYKRTLRIGCCVFDDCMEDCILLIPRTVRRRMATENNLYIPRLSRVCEQHLQDQNWEELISNTSSEFTAEHCQDLKNIISEACQANFDFEHIETVDARLVRYWFEVNKTEFNNIFNQFPILKNYKNAKTAFALYLMHLQGASVHTISLLLKMGEKIVTRRISVVKDIVKCESYGQLRLKYFDDSDSD